jgi:hypothetical protein
MKSVSSTLLYQHFIKDGVFEFLKLPFWWYSSGLKNTLVWFSKSLQSSIRFFGLDVWIKNLFVPMYGENSVSGRLISFFVRLFMIVFRGIGVIVSFIFLIVAVVFYLFIFPVFVIGLIYHFIGMFG